MLENVHPYDRIVGRQLLHPRRDQHRRNLKFGLLQTRVCSQDTRSHNAIHNEEYAATVWCMLDQW